MGSYDKKIESGITRSNIPSNPISIPNISEELRNFLLSIYSWILLREGLSNNPSDRFITSNEINSYIPVDGDSDNFYDQFNTQIISGKGNDLRSVLSQVIQWLFNIQRTLGDWPSAIGQDGLWGTTGNDFDAWEPKKYSKGSRVFHIGEDQEDYCYEATEECASGDTPGQSSKWSRTAPSIYQGIASTANIARRMRLIEQHLYDLDNTKGRDWSIQDGWEHS